MRRQAEPNILASKGLDDEINIISGLVNLNLDWDRTKKENRSLIRKLARKRASR